MKNKSTKKLNRQGSGYIVIILFIVITLLTYKMVSINHIKTTKKINEDLLNTELQLVQAYAFEYYVQHDNFPGTKVNKNIDYSDSLYLNDINNLSKYNVFRIDNISEKLNVSSGTYYLVIKDDVVINVLYKNNQ